MLIQKRKNTYALIPRKITSGLLFLVIALQLTVMPVGQEAYAQAFSDLALANSMVHLTPAYVPVILKGVKIYPQEPFKFDFIIDKGDSDYQGQDLEDEVSKLVKYFLASLTIPDDDLWVNLSPYEKERIIPKIFGETEMGRDLLAQDYILKQLTASLLYPEDEVGSEFWDRVYSEAQEKFGTTDIPVETFNKIWIIPEKAVIYEDGEVAYVTKSKLKVMLEEDYLAYRQAGLAMSNRNDTEGPVSEQEQEDKDEKIELSTQILREVVIPAIEKEVNEGKNFASLRQIYNSLILATWFKRNLKASMLGKLYLDQNKIKGVDVEDKEVKEKIYSKYLKAFQDGVYDYIKEEYDYTTQQIIPRKYFSGGTVLKVGDIVEDNGRVQDISAKVPLVAQINVMPEMDNGPLVKDQDNSMLTAEEANAQGESLWGMRHHHFHEIGNMSHALDGYRVLIYQDNKELIDDNDDYKSAFDFISSINPSIEGIFKPKGGLHDNIQLYWSFEGFRTRVIQNKVHMELVLRKLRDAFEGREKGSMYQVYIDRILSTYSLFGEYLNRILDGNLKKEKTDLAFIMYHTINSVPASASGAERLVARISQGKVQVNQSFVDLDSKGYVLEVDKLRTTEVLSNILKNANEKLADGGRIDISSDISLSKKTVVITIKDNGGGITLENPNDVFKDFVTTKGAFGTGIGLALSKRIIEAHGGTLTAENWKDTIDGELKSGAIFRITLPVINNKEVPETDRALLSDVKVAALTGGAKIYSTLSVKDFQSILTEQKFYEVRDKNGVTSLFDTGRSWVTTDTPFATLNGRYGIMSKLVELGASTDADAEPIVVVDWGAGDAVGVVGLSQELAARGIRNVKIIAFADQFSSAWARVPGSVSLILDTPNNFKVNYKKIMNDIGITKGIDLVYSNLGLSHYLKDGREEEVRSHIEDVVSLLTDKGEIRTSIISGFGPGRVGLVQLRAQRVIEENFSAPKAWREGRLFYYRISKPEFVDGAMLGSDNEVPKTVSIRNAVLDNVRPRAKDRYSIKGDISVSPVSGEMSEEVAEKIKYLFSEIANELIDNAVEAQKEGDIIVRFEPTEEQGVRFKVANLGGIDWNKLISKAKAAARNNALFVNKEDGKIYSGDFYGFIEGFEPVSENAVDSIVQLKEGRLKLITAGGLTEEKGEGVQGGAGYGLQLVQGRVEQLGGVLELNSQPESTTFSVTLPKISSVNYVEGSNVDVEFTFVDNQDSAMLGDKFTELAASLGVDEEAGAEIINAAKNLVTQVHDRLKGVKTVLISGYSSMLSKIMFETTWDNLFPGEKMPRVVALSGEVNNILYKDQISYDEIIPAGKKDEALRIALDEEGLDYEDIRTNQKVLFLDEYVGSGQKYKMMRYALVDQLSFSDINFGFFFSQGSKNVQGEDILIGTTDGQVALELATVAVELSERTQFYQGQRGDPRDKFKARNEFLNVISSFMQEGLKGDITNTEVNEAVSEEAAVGGINLDTRDLKIETTGDGPGFEFSFDMNGYENMPITGFSPVIIQIVPITNAAMLIGR